MARTQIAADTFERASLNASYTNWTQIYTFFGTLSIKSSQYFGGPGYARWDGTNNSNVETGQSLTASGVFSDDQYAEITISNLAYQSLGYYLGVIVRSTGPNDAGDPPTNQNYYWARVQLDGLTTFRTELGMFVNGTPTTLAGASPEVRIAWAVGDKLSLEVEGQSPNITVRVMRTPSGESTPVLAHANLELTGRTEHNSGKPGVFSSESAYAYGDNWNAGNYSDGASAVAKIKLLTHPSAASASGVEGWVLNADLSAVLGHFSGKAFKTSTESGQAVLKVSQGAFGASALTSGDTIYAVAQNSLFTTGLISGTVIEEE